MISRLRSMLASVQVIQTSTGKKMNVCNLARDIVENRRLVYFGEIHSVPKIVELQQAVLESMTDAAKVNTSKVHVFLEHFSIDDQKLIDDYIVDKIKTEKELVEKYEENSTEGHDIEKYFSIFNHVKNNSSYVELRGAFVPRQYAKMLVKEGEEFAYLEAIKNEYLEEKDKMNGSEEHYNFFESLISGRDPNSDQSIGENFRRIFPAQVLKDCVMASMVRREIQKSDPQDKFLVIAGLGHLEYKFGVPERVAQHNLISDDETCIITVRDMEDLPVAIDISSIGKVEKFDNVYPADYIYLFNEEEKEIKTEISAAYDKVGATAKFTGDLTLAGKVMTRLGYTADHIRVAGEDAYNYQGVGCPHHLANIGLGEQVLDLGSGLGVDSFIAASQTGPSGSVVGLDISKMEVEHAQARAEHRHLENVTFVNGDMEKMPFDDNKFDVVISNGAFCLAPNKEAAFKEIYRVLKPGGRFSVCCTTTKVDLDKDVDWPICMRVFMPLNHTKSLLENVGFSNVIIDDSDSKMTFEEDDLQVESVEGEVDDTRYRIHGNTPEFKHLENFDMNQLCARVVLFGTKGK